MKRLKTPTPFEHYKMRYQGYYWEPYNCVWGLGYRSYVDDLYSPGVAAWRSEDLKIMVRREICAKNL